MNELEYVLDVFGIIWGILSNKLRPGELSTTGSCLLLLIVTAFVLFSI